MRRRLLTTTLAAVAVAVLLLGVPLAVAVRSVLLGEALDSLQRQAEQMQALLNREVAAGADPRLLLDVLAGQAGDRLVLLDAGARGLVVLDTGGPPALPPSTADLQAAAQGSVGRVADDGVLAVSVPVRAAGVSQILRVLRDDAELRASVLQAWVALGLLALTAFASAAVVARWQAARLARPLEALADSARRLGQGDFTARAPRSGIPETDAVATALDSTADRLGVAVTRSSTLAGDASHQLRTPLTALRLDLEALQDSGADAALVDAALTEADRLEATIRELLSLTEPAVGDEEVDLAALATERLDAWASLAKAQGRRVVLALGDAPRVRARAAALGQCLQVLLDNALEHGRGTITVSVEEIAEEGAPPRGARLCVADEGPGIDAEQAGRLFNGGGRGLQLARSLAAAEGGRLSLDDARHGPGGARLCLVLPASAAVDGADA